MSIAERRIDRLINRHERRLPAFLSPQPDAIGFHDPPPRRRSLALNERRCWSHPREASTISRRPVARKITFSDGNDGRAEAAHHCRQRGELFAIELLTAAAALEYTGLTLSRIGG
jgi:histidine ammonia-lyase